MSLILSPHFRLSEFTASQTAKSRKILNIPTIAIIENLQQLCINVLEPLRSHADCPIVVGSGYRCPELNRAVGGSSSSQHMTGCACDIHLPSTDIGREWFEWIKSRLVYDQLIWEHETASSSRFWIHVSFVANGYNRQQVIDGLVKYK